MKILRLAIGLVLVLAQSAAYAVPIVSQPVLDDGTSFGTYASLFGGSQVADNFSLTQQVDMTGLTWWGSYFSLNTGDNFTIRLFSDNGGQPASNPDILEANALSISRSLLPGVTDFFGEVMYQYDVALNTTLGAGQYYLSILNDADDEWYWADAANGGDLTNWFRVDQTDPWSASGFYDLAFMIDGTVVSPVSEAPVLLLVLMSLSVLLLARRCHAI